MAKEKMEVKLPLEFYFLFVLSLEKWKKKYIVEIKKKIQEGRGDCSHYLWMNITAIFTTFFVIFFFSVSKL